MSIVISRDDGEAVLPQVYTDRKILLRRQFAVSFIFRHTVINQTVRCVVLDGYAKAEVLH